MKEFIGVVIPTQHFFSYFISLLKTISYTPFQSPYREQLLNRCELYSNTDFSCIDAFDTDEQKRFLKEFLKSHIKPIIEKYYLDQWCNRIKPYFSDDIYNYCIFPYICMPKIICVFPSYSFSMSDQINSVEKICFGLECKTIYTDTSLIPSDYINPRGMNFPIYSPYLDNISDIDIWCKYLKLIKKYYNKCFKIKYYEPKFIRMYIEDPYTSSPSRIEI